MEILFWFFSAFFLIVAFSCMFERPLTLPTWILFMIGICLSLITVSFYKSTKYEIVKESFNISSMSSVNDRFTIGVYEQKLSDKSTPVATYVVNIKSNIDANILYTPVNVTQIDPSINDSGIPEATVTKRVRMNNRWFHIDKDVEVTKALLVVPTNYIIKPVKEYK